MAQRQPDNDEPLDLAAVEAGLRVRLAELRDSEAELRRPPERGSNIGFGKRIGDGTNEAISRFNEVGVAGSLDALEGRVTRALAKLAEGSYGVCDECGEPIPVGRLRAAPESVFCLRHADRSR